MHIPHCIIQLVRNSMLVFLSFTHSRSEVTPTHLKNTNACEVINFLLKVLEGHEIVSIWIFFSPRQVACFYRHKKISDAKINKNLRKYLLVHVFYATCINKTDVCSHKVSMKFVIQWKSKSYIDIKMKLPEYMIY